MVTIILMIQNTFHKIKLVWRTSNNRFFIKLWEGSFTCSLYHEQVYSSNLLAIKSQSECYMNKNLLVGWIVLRAFFNFYLFMIWWTVQSYWQSILPPGIHIHSINTKYYSKQNYRVLHKVKNLSSSPRCKNDTGSFWRKF